MSSRSDLSVIASAAQLLSIVLFVAALYLARDVFIPLALAILLSFLLNPLVTWLQRRGVSNTLAVIATATLAFACISGGLILLGRELTELVSELPQYREELVTKARSIAGLRSGMGDSLGELAEEVSEAMEPDSETATVSDENDDASLVDEQSTTTELDPTKLDFADAPPDESQALSEDEPGFFGTWTNRILERVQASDESVVPDGKSSKTPLFVKQVSEQFPLLSWATTATTFLGPLGTVGMVAVFVLFLLIYRDDLRDRIIMVISHGNYVLTTEALTEVGRRISRYLVAQSIVNATYGAILAFGLFVIGRFLAPDGVFPNLGLWGVLATCFRFVPYVGPIVGAVFPLAMSLTIFPGYSVFASVLGLIVVMELLSNNVMEPWLYGSSTGISAIAVIVAAVFWGWLWGPLGLLLSTPLTVCLVVLGRTVPRFRLLETLLGEKVDIQPSLRFYQRMLAGDEHQATQLLRTYSEADGTVATCDDVLIPTMKRLHNDRLHGELTAANSVELLEAVERVVEQVDWKAATTAADSRPGASVYTELSSEERGDDQPTTTSPRPLCIGVPAHHCSDDILVRLLRDTLDDVIDMQVVADSELPGDIGAMIARQKPSLVVLTNVPPGGFSQARFLCRTIREHGFKGTLIVACIGSFKHFDRLMVKFRNSGATYMTTTFRQTHFKIRSLVTHEVDQSPPKMAPNELVSRDA